MATVPFETTDLGLLITLPLDRLEQRLDIMRRGRYPLRFRVALRYAITLAEDIHA